MKKKVMYAVACVALAAVAGWNYQQSQQESELSDLTLENIEALASGEGGPDWDHYKLVFEGKQCCTEDPYLDCSGVYSPC